MFIRSSMILAVFTLASSSMSAPVEERPVVPIVYIQPSPETVLVPINEFSNAELNGRNTSFIFKNPPPYPYSSSQFFNWDTYREDTGLQEKLYQLNCSVTIDWSFKSTTAYDMYNQTTAPHVKLLDKTRIDGNEVRITCEAGEDSCLSQDKEVCEAMPHWIEENGIN